MFDALKKLIGADEESKKRRRELDEQEQRERDERVRQHKEALQKTIEAEKKQ
ncbi:MAG TPA: hypothetical protein VF987_08780 [Rhodospirillales bacterium]